MRMQALVTRGFLLLGGWVDLGMIWIKRMFLGGFIVNIIYISIMLWQPELSILVNTLISGTLTGLIILFLIIKEHI